MTEFESKKFRLMALDEEQTDMLYWFLLCKSLSGVVNTHGVTYAEKVRQLIDDLLENDAPPGDSPIEGRDQTIARLTKENDRLHNHLHLVEQGVVASIRRFLNENYGPEKGDI